MIRTKDLFFEHIKSTNFIQLDAFYFVKSVRSDTLKPDKDGYAVYKDATEQAILDTTADVRILIRPNVKKGKVLKYLEKVKTWIKNDEKYEEYANRLTEGSEHGGIHKNS